MTQEEIKSGYSYHAQHKPSGEDWHIIGINVKGNQVCAAGYPPSIGKLSDCEKLEMFKPLTEQELSHRQKEFGDNWI